MEYRQPFWINIYNRLRQLDFSEGQDGIESVGVTSLNPTKRLSKINSSAFDTLHEESQLEEEVDSDSLSFDFEDLNQLRN